MLVRKLYESLEKISVFSFVVLFLILLLGMVSGFVTEYLVGFEIDLLILLVVFYALSEVIYIVESRITKKPYKSLVVVLQKKFEAFFDVLLIGFNLIGLSWIVRYFNLLRILPYIAVGILIIFVAVAILYLNKWLANIGKVKQNEKTNQNIQTYYNS